MDQDFRDSKIDRGPGQLRSLFELIQTPNLNFQKLKNNTNSLIPRDLSQDLVSEMKLSIPSV